MYWLIVLVLLVLGAALKGRAGFFGMLFVIAFFWAAWVFVLTPIIP